MAICDDKPRPLALLLANASRSEIKLVFDTLGCMATRKKPKRIIGDKAYYSDKHDAEFSRQGIGLIAPNKSNRKKNLPVKRPLRRYKRRKNRKISLHISTITDEQLFSMINTLTPFLALFFSLISYSFLINSNN